MTIRLARESDAAVLAPHLREADLREIQAVYAEPAASVLARGIVQSERCFTAVDSADRPVALFGVVRAVRSGVGIPWMVASNALAAHRGFVVRSARRWLDCLQEGFAELWNCLDERNVEDLRWVQWCDFEVIGTIPEYGVEKRPFIEFRRLAKDKAHSGVMPGRNAIECGAARPTEEARGVPRSVMREASEAGEAGTA